MKKNKFNSTMLHIGTTAALLLGANQVMANSLKIFNPDNSHYYQRFDAAVNWGLAKANCESFKAHLTTISDDKENSFIYSQLVSASNNNSSYFIGGYNDKTYGWLWDINKPIVYSNWNTRESQPLIGNSTYSYISMVASKGGLWNSASDMYIVNGVKVGYVCEWDGNNYVGAADVPDLNGNGVGENAALYHDYKNDKHTVDIRDPKTHKQLYQLTFDTNLNPPVGLAIIPDMNGTGNHGVAVLSTSQKNNVKIKDIMDSKAPIRSISFLTAKHKVRAISVKPDENNNGFAELTVVGVLENGKTTTETRDSDTGDLLYSDQF